MERYKKYFIIHLVILLSVLPQFVWTEETSEIFSPTESTGKKYVLSLEEVTRLALQNNFDIQLAQYDAQIAQTQKGVAESIYDTVLDAEIKYRDNQRGRTTTITGTKSLENDYNLGLTKKLPTGTTLGLDMTNARDWTNSIFATLNPSHDSALSVEMEQALGKNFFGLQDRGNIKISQIDIENSGYTSLEKIEQNIAQVQRAYWDLVLYLNRVKVEERMVEQAKRLYDLHQEKFTDGLIESPELLAAEANYKTRVNELLLAQNQAKIKENVLRFLLNITDDLLELVPAETFHTDAVQEVWEASLKTAFENRRDYKRVRNDIDAKNIQLAMKKNNLWPEINLAASFARNGIGDHFDNAVTNITQEDNPDLFIGARFSFPLENTEARSRLKAAEIEKAKAILNIKLTERKIAIDIMDQVRTCNVLKELSMNSQNISDLQAKKLTEEEKRFSHGRSDTDTIVRFQESLIQAQWKALEDQFNYYTAKIDLKLKEGTLLKE